MKKFELGRLFATPGALAEMKRLNIDSIELLGRHQGGDWLEMDTADKLANEEAIKHGSRIFSRYTIKGYRLKDSGHNGLTWQVEKVRFWVITEADRSATTILLPSEY